jgi:hypothetical protein
MVKTSAIDINLLPIWSRYDVLLEFYFLLPFRLENFISASSDIGKAIFGSRWLSFLLGFESEF